MSLWKWCDDWLCYWDTIRTCSSTRQGCLPWVDNLSRVKRARDRCECCRIRRTPKEFMLMIYDLTESEKCAPGHLGYSLRKIYFIRIGINFFDCTNSSGILRERLKKCKKRKIEFRVMSWIMQDISPRFWKLKYKMLFGSHPEYTFIIA